MELRPDRLAVNIAKFGMRQVQQLGASALEMMQSQELAERLEHSACSDQIALLDERVQVQALHLQPPEHELLQNRHIIKMIAGGMVRAHKRNDLVVHEYSLILKRMIVEDMCEEFTLESLKFEPSDLAIVKRYVPEF